jgi:hypothetical protein
MLTTDNPHHWEFSTRKLADPKWQGHDGQRLTVEVRAEQPNDLVIMLTENVFRPYRGTMREFVAVVKLAGGNDAQSVALEPEDFLASDGAVLSAWQNVDLLSFRAYSERGEQLLGSKTWDGPQPVFTKLWWQSERAKTRAPKPMIAAAATIMEYRLRIDKRSDRLRVTAPHQAGLSGDQARTPNVVLFVGKVRLRRTMSATRIACMHRGEG